MIIAQKKKFINFSGFVQDVPPIFVAIVVTDNYWFCPTCRNPAFNAVFLDEDINERCKILFDSMKAIISNFESEQFSTKIFVKFL